jgi:glutaminase
MSKLAEKVVAEIEALEIAQELLKISAAYDNLNDQLKKYVKEFGEIQVGGGVFGFTESTSWEVEPSVMKELFVALACDGVNPYEHAAIPAAKLKKLGYDESTMLNLGAKKKSNPPRFGFKKAKV